MFNEKILQKTYLFSLAGVGFFLPISVWFLSVFTFLSGVLWIADNGYKRRPSLFHKNRTVLWAVLIYLVLVLWIIRSSDLAFGIHDLKIKLPLLVFPLIIGLGWPLSKNELRTILTLFIAGVITASVIAVIKMWGTPFDFWTAKRDSVFPFLIYRVILICHLNRRFYNLLCGYNREQDCQICIVAIHYYYLL